MAEHCRCAGRRVSAPRHPSRPQRLFRRRPCDRATTRVGRGPVRYLPGGRTSGPRPLLRVEEGSKRTRGTGHGRQPHRHAKRGRVVAAAAAIQRRGRPCDAAPPAARSEEQPAAGSSSSAAGCRRDAPGGIRPSFLTGDSRHRLDHAQPCRLLPRRLRFRSPRPEGWGCWPSAVRRSSSRSDSPPRRCPWLQR